MAREQRLIPGIGPSRRTLEPEQLAALPLFGWRPPAPIVAPPPVVFAPPPEPSPPPPVLVVPKTAPKPPRPPREKRAPTGEPRFGGITGKARVEYRVPGSVLDATGSGDARAVCYGDADDLLRFARQKAAALEARSTAAEKIRESMLSRGQISTAGAKRVARQGAIAASKGSDFAKLAAELAADLGRLRAQGVVGRVPACVYRSTGKKQGTERAQRRSTAIHERFHAAVRRQEVGQGLKDSDQACVNLLNARMREEFDGAFAGIAERGARLRWGNMRYFPEEVLARTEEIRLSCRRSADDCDFTKRRLARTLEAVGAPPNAIAEIAEKLETRYGGALAFTGQVLRACAAGKR